MRSLQSINNARAEARYVSRTWKNDSTTDVAGHVHFDTPKTPQPDDIIKVWVANPEKAGWLMAVEITRAQHEAEIKAMNEALDAKWRAEGRIK
jgi:hypothetical protein